LAPLKGLYFGLIWLVQTSSNPRPPTFTAVMREHAD
jgi:hypothetical protein